MAAQRSVPEWSVNPGCTSASSRPGGGRIVLGLVGFVSVAALYGVAIALSVLVGGVVILWASSEHRLKFLLLGLALYTPLEPTLLNWVPESWYFPARFAVYGLTAICFSIVWLRRLVEGRPLWRRTPLDVPMLVFILISLGSMAINQSVPVTGALIAYQPFLRFIILVFLVLQFVEFSRDDARRLLLGLSVIVLLVSIVGLAQAWAGPSFSELLAPRGAEFGGRLEGALTQPVFEGQARIFSTLGRYNTFGLFLGIFLVMAAPFLSRPGRERPWLLVAAAVAIPCLVLAASRTAWLATGVGLNTVFLLTRPLRAAVLTLAVLLGLLVAVVSWPESVQFYSAREFGTSEISPLQRLLETFSPEYVRTRLHYGRLYYIFVFPRDLFELDLRAFLVGLGPGSVGRRAQELYGLFALTPVGVPESHQHFIIDVNWAFILAQVGVVGLAAFGWALVRLLSAIWTARRRTDDPVLTDLTTGFLGLFAMFIVGGFFYNVWEIRPISLYFWLFAGIVIKLQSTRSTPPPVSRLRDTVRTNA